jgi:Gram-negative bacterial TonB protein C-terminal
MLRSLFVLSIALGLGVPPASAAANRSPVSLGKSSKWEMRYDEDSCTLAAQFGANNDSVLLVLNRYDPGDGFDLRLYGKALRFGGGIKMPIEVAFGAQPLLRMGAISATATDAAKTPAVIISGARLDGWTFPEGKYDPSIQPPAVTPQQEATVTSITFKRPGAGPIQLQTGSMAGPMQAMRKCTDDLLRHWGFDPAVQGSLSRRVQPASDPGKWLRSGDYPNGALWNGENGLVRFRLDVEADGSVSNCRILFRTNPDSFADLSCKLLRERARLTPALDSGGKPVRSYYLSQVRWVAGSDW